jgi:hypothetical protein
MIESYQHLPLTEREKCGFGENNFGGFQPRPERVECDFSG